MIEERILLRLLGVVLAASFAWPAHGAEYRGETNVPVEIAFEAVGDHADPFNTIEVDAVFTDPAGRQIRVPAFWAGGRSWKVRYASPLAGVHRFRTDCRGWQDPGLVGVAGEVTIVPYRGRNALYARGPLRVAADKRYLEHSDGTPFFWLGDTWWMGLCNRLRWPDEFKRLAGDRKAKGFNVIQIVAGLYPDMPAFDPRGANEAGFPWEADHKTIRPAYFDAADARLRYLVDEGFTPCVVGAWGYFLPWTGEAKMKRHWRYLIARWGALSVVWCAAGEANLPWYLAKGFPYDDREQVRGWTELLRYIRATDPFRRPLTIHPTAIRRYTSRHATDNPGLLDFDMLQTPHGQREAVPITVNAMRESYAAAPTMPVINGEASYEMLLDSLPTRWTRTMFWLCMTNGAAGHTYGANGIWQCNRKDQAHGASPHGGTYGKITWDEAMRLPGSQQVAIGKKLFEKYPWHRFRPHPEWVAVAGPRFPDMATAHWIWSPEGSPARDAPVGKRYFRKTIAIPDGASITRARLWITADDAFSVRLNGQAVGSAGNWKMLHRFEGLQRFLKPGDNVLAIVGENGAADVPANPAGLIAKMEVELSGGRSLVFSSDATWRAAKTEVAGWDAPAFDDHSWPAATVAARYGDSPWGTLETDTSGLSGAQAVGIADGVRIIYVPNPEPVTVRHLGAKGVFTAFYFDPLSGARTKIGRVSADDAGTWTCDPPPTAQEDWALVLETP
jgi:hypothetical protein